MEYIYQSFVVAVLGLAFKDFLVFAFRNNLLGFILVPLPSYGIILYIIALAREPILSETDNLIEQLPALFQSFNIF